MLSTGKFILLLSLVGGSFASPAQVKRRDYTTTAPPSAPTPPGTIADCGAYHLVKPGETCITIGMNSGLTTEQFRKLNPSINTDCTNLVVGWDYCIAKISKVVPRGVQATPTPSQSPGATPASGYIPPPNPTKIGTTKCCREWHTVTEGDTCLGITSNAGITFEEFRSLNPDVNGACSNLWIGYSYCIDGDTSCNSTPTQPPVSTPTPIQGGMVSGCKKFYKAKGGDYCQSIAWEHNISVADFIAWNPAVGKDCSAVLVGYYYCVGK